MLSRSLLAGVQSRSCPASWARTSAGSSVRNRMRPSSRTRSGSRSTRRDCNACSMSENCTACSGPSKANQEETTMRSTGCRLTVTILLVASVAAAERPEPAIRGDREVVFVGYGIRAAEWRWDDYKDADLRGKVVLMLVNDPGLQDSTVFNGRALTYYGRWTYKLEETARRGALGVLLIHTTESATYPWEVVRGSWSVEQFKLDRPAAQSLAFAGWVTAAAVQAALARTGWNLDSLTRAAARRDFRPVATGLHAAVDIASAV